MYRPQLPLPNARRDYASPSLGSAAQGRHHSLQFRRVMATATIAGGVVLLGAAQPAGDPTSLNGAASTGLHYDIHLTIVTTPAPDPTGVAATPTTTTALAHAQVANGKAHIDIADGYFSGGWLTPGDFLIVRDSGRTIIVVSPKNKLYANVDIGQLAQGANSPANAFGGMAGVQATKVKIDATPLASEKLGQVTAQKFEVTEDYTVSLAIMGMTSTTVTHTTTDLWFAPALTAIINPFAVPITRDAPTTMFFGQDYATQMSAAKFKLPAGSPIKYVAVSTLTDAKGNHSGTNTTWELGNVAQATVSDAAFDVPAGYTQYSGSIAMMPSGAGGPGSPVPATTTAAGNGKGAGGAVAGAATNAASGAANSAAQGAQSTVNQAASDAASSAVKKILHFP